MSRSSGSYSWLPGFLRRFLNLDDEMPNYDEQGSYYSAPAYSTPSRPAVYSAPSYKAPEVPRFATTYTPAEPAPQRFTSINTAPAGPPPPTPRTVGIEGNGGFARGINLPTGAPEGYVQPIGYLLRSYARGALPPQGLEQFTRETRATTTDVWNFYSYWTRFQADEVFRIGRELLDTVFEDRPGDAEATASSASGQTIRRIKVTTANSNGEAKPVDRAASADDAEAPSRGIYDAEPKTDTTTDLDGGGQK